MKKFIATIISALCLILISSCEKLSIDREESHTNYTEKDLTGMWRLAQMDIYYWDKTYDDYARDRVITQDDLMQDDPNSYWEFRENELIVYYTEWEWNPAEWRCDSTQMTAKYGYYIENNVLFVDDYQEPNEYIIEKVEGNNLWLSCYSNKQAVPFPKEGSEDEVVFKYRYMNKTIYRFRIKGTELTGKVDYSYGLK